MSHLARSVPPPPAVVRYALTSGQRCPRYAHDDKVVLNVNVVRDVCKTEACLALMQDPITGILRRSGTRPGLSRCCLLLKPGSWNCPNQTRGKATTMAFFAIPKVEFSFRVTPFTVGFCASRPSVASPDSIGPYPVLHRLLRYIICLELVGLHCYFPSLPAII